MMASEELVFLKPEYLKFYSSASVEDGPLERACQSSIQSSENPKMTHTSVSEP